MAENSYSRSSENLEFDDVLKYLGVFIQDVPRSV